MGFRRVCTVYGISFSSTQRLGGHIPQALEAQNKSETQTTQSLTPSIPSLSSLSHQKYSRRSGFLNIDSAWSRACVPFHPSRPLHAPSSPPHTTCRDKRGTLSTLLAISTHISNFHAEHCLALPVALSARPLCSLASSTSTTPLALRFCISRPLVFSAPRRATPVPSNPLPCPPLDNFWTAEPAAWAVTFGYVQLSNIVYSASRVKQS